MVQLSVELQHLFPQRECICVVALHAGDIGPVEKRRKGELWFFRKLSVFDPRNSRVFIKEGDETEPKKQQQKHAQQGHIQFFHFMTPSSESEIQEGVVAGSHQRHRGQTQKQKIVHIRYDHIDFLLFSLAVFIRAKRSECIADGLRNRRAADRANKKEREIVEQHDGGLLV